MQRFSGMVFGVILAAHAWSSVHAADDKAEKWSALLNRKPIAIADADSALDKLLKERHNAALDELRDLQGLYMAGRCSMAEIAGAIPRVVDSFCELDGNHADRLTMLEQHVDFLRHAEEMAQAQFKQGIAGRNEVQRARYERLNGEIRWEREKGKK